MFRATGFFVAVLAIGFLSWRSLLAQGELSLVLKGESRQASQLLEEIQQKFANNQSNDALDLLFKLLDRTNDDLIAIKAPSPVGVQTFSSLRFQANLLLSQLPAEVLSQVRRRQDPQAQRWLDQGLKGPDPLLLMQIIEGAFISSPAEKAIDALGDLAFEQGDYDSACYWWQFLLPRTDQTSPFTLHYPQPQLPPARNQAKLLLARLFRDGPDSVQADLKTFQMNHRTTSGKLAGREGNYTDILRDLIRETPTASHDLSWSTFSAHPDRNTLGNPPGNHAALLGLLCRQPRLILDLTSRKILALGDEAPNLRQLGGVDLPVARDLRKESTSQMARSLAFHPVIGRDQVILADARIILGIDPGKKTVSTWFDHGLNKINFALTPPLPAVADLRYTLSMTDNFVYARLGPQSIPPRPLDGKVPAASETSLVCLQLHPPADSARVRWQVQPGQPGEPIFFEGAPLVDQDHAWIASTLYDNENATTRIQCYPARAKGSPQPIWTKEICQIRYTGSSEPSRYRHPLLTRAGPLLLYLTHQGAVVALDRLTGKRAWSLRYPSLPMNADSNTNPTDLGPCLAVGQQIFLAPADSDLLLCLDRATGQVLWQRQKLAVTHLLGVSTPARAVGPSVPLLILTTSQGLLALDARSGSGENGWRIPDSGGPLPTLGRGLLFGDLVLWPTVKGILAIHQADGSPVSIPNLQDNVLPGNLALTSHCLAVTTRSHLFLYTLDPPAP